MLIRVSLPVSIRVPFPILLGGAAMGSAQRCRCCSCWCSSWLCTWRTTSPTSPQLREGARLAEQGLASTLRQSATLVKSSVFQPRKTRPRHKSLHNGDGVPAEVCRGIAKAKRDHPKKDGLQLGAGGAPHPQAAESEHGGEVRPMEGGGGGWVWGEEGGGSRRGDRWLWPGPLIETY